MFYKSELQEMIDRGLIVSDTIQVVRKKGQIFDVVLEGELVRDDEIITFEKLDDVMRELN